MKEIFDSISDTIKSRLTNSIYGTFTMCWIVFHWNFLYAVFALDDTKIFQLTNKLKNDYLWGKYFSIHDPYFWFSWFMPFFVTWLIIWKFPNWFLISGYKKEEKYKTEKKKIKLIEEKEIKSLETALEKEALKTITAVAQKVIQEKKIKDTDPTILWEEEFNDFRKNEMFFKLFYLIINSIYERRGFIDDGMNHKIPTDILVYSDTNELIKIIGNKIEFTPKGKFFVKKYNENLGRF
ncbi:MAG: hypothetical protein WAV23_01410 [Minisyncoccia bacterium]